MWSLKMREGMLVCLCFILGGGGWGVVGGWKFLKSRPQTPAISLQHVYIVTCRSLSWILYTQSIYTNHHPDMCCCAFSCSVFPSLFVCMSLNLKLLIPSGFGSLTPHTLNFNCWTLFKPEYMNVSEFWVQLLLFHVYSDLGCFSHHLICNPWSNYLLK